MSPPSSSSDYKVGRGRPPKHTQYRKGMSGNPGGRRKAPPSLKELSAAVLGSEIVLTEDGRRRSAIRMEAVLLALTQAAIHGNTRAASILIGLYERHLGAAHVIDVLPEEDQAILARAKQRLADLQPASDAPESGGGDDV